MPRLHHALDTDKRTSLCFRSSQEMATGESVPLLSTAPEKTLLNKDFWPAVTNNESKVKHAEYEDFE